MKLAGIESLRVIGFFAVIIIHVNAAGLFGPYLNTGFIIDEISRFAVPLFFLISGFFWKRIYIESPIRSSIQFFTKIIPLFLIWFFIYNAIEISGIFGKSIFKGRFIDYLSLPMTGGAGFHLWFLPALYMGSALCWILISLYGTRSAFIVAINLYLFGCTLGVILPWLGRLITTFLFRNGLIEAPLFLMIGYHIRTNDIILSRYISVIIIAMGAALHTMEGLIRGSYPYGHDFSLGTVPFTVGIFLLLKDKLIDDHGWGRHVLGAYLIHVVVLKFITYNFTSHGLTYALVTTVAVGATSLFLSSILKHSIYTAWLVQTK